MTLSEETWARESDVDRRRLVVEAATLGFRLVVVTQDGTEWQPDPDPSTW